MGQLNLDLFGGLRLTQASGEPVQMPSKKGQALLAYLALNPDQPQTRDRLTALLWPDRGEEQARHSLRQELLTLRKTVNDGAPITTASDGRLVIDRDVVDVDVWTFEDLQSGGSARKLEQAAELYTGELLDGVDSPSTAFDEWCQAERSRLLDLVFGVLERLAEAHSKAGAPDAAIDVARRLAVLDPLREGAHRLLMRLYQRAGRRSDALRQYQTCTLILRRELDVEPEIDTSRLHDEIRGKRGSDDQGRPDLISETSGERSALPLPSKPSIAVMPFDNLSGDIDQEYFADGIAEEIITTLGRFRWCFVIARNTSFAYKGQTANVGTVARELGVRYILEGSVRKSGQRVRVTAELSDASTGQHIWAEHYDRDLGDIFALQDEISEAVIASVAPQFMSAEAERARRKDPANLDAWDYCMRGRWHVWQFNEAGSTEAKILYQKALDLDPDYPQALADLAALYVIDLLFGWGTRSAAESAVLARPAADKALQFDSHDAWVHAVAGMVDAFHLKKEESISRLRRALEINPNLAAAHGFLGWVQNFIGETEAAVGEIETAIRLSPRDPFIVLWHSALAGAAFINGCYDDAAQWSRQAIADRKDFPSGHRILAASLGQLGDIKGARAALEDLLRLIPDQTLAGVNAQIPYREQDMARFLEGLKKAGLPE